MSTPILMSFVVAVMFFQIGCSDDKKDKKQTQALVNACLFDPSGQCQNRAKMLMENPNGAAKLAGIGLGTSNGTQLRQLTNGDKAPVLPAAIRAQAAEVQRKLAENSQNPLSDHHDFGQGSRVINDHTPVESRGSNQVVAGGLQGGAPASVPNLPPSGGGGGEVMR